MFGNLVLAGGRWIPGARKPHDIVRARVDPSILHVLTLSLLYREMAITSAFLKGYGPWNSS